MNEKEYILPNEKDVPEERRGTWEERYEHELARIAEKESLLRDEFVDVVWERGILDHIAPQDEKEWSVRKEGGKDVWKRDAAELYWRLLYAAGNTREAAVRNLTLVGGYTTLAIIKSIYGIPQGKLQSLFREGASGEAINPVIPISEAIIERAKAELRGHGEMPHEKLIPWGSRGMFQGIPIRIERYTETGMIVLKGESYEDHGRLGEATGFTGTVLPQELNPDDFVPR